MTVARPLDPTAGEATRGGGPGPLDVLVVASWYPAIDDAGAGRFVADQVAALARGGRVSPRVVSFEPVRLVGPASTRNHQVSVIEQAFWRAVTSEPRVFEPRGHAVDAPVPVARLSIAAGTAPDLGSTAAIHHRVVALEALAARLRADAGSLPSVVHAHTGFPDGAAAAALADRLGCPLVITEHATFLERILADPDQRAAYADACRRAARVVAVSELLARQIRDAVPEVADRLTVIPNAIAIDAFAPGAGERRVPDELLFVGYRKEIKGIETLLRSLAIVRAARPAARLRLIGRSPTPALERRWQDLAAELGLVGAVDFEDVTDRPGVAAAMARASVFVHASRYETFGVVAAEALAAGMPVVATDSGGVAEVLGPSPQRLGAIVPVGDVNAFAAAVLETLDRRASFPAEELRASVAARFGDDVVARRLADLYRDVIVGRGSATPDSRRESPLASAADAGRPPTILGLDRTAVASRLARIPLGVRDGLELVTAAEPRSVVPPTVGRLIEVAVRAVPAPARVPAGGRPAVARIRLLLSDPAGTIRGRLGKGPLAPEAIQAAARAVGAALGSGGDSPRAVVPLDGRDALVAAELAVDGSATIAGGGLRRIGDHASLPATVTGASEADEG